MIVMLEEFNDLLYIITLGLGLMFLILMVVTLSWVIGIAIMEKFL